MEVREIILFLLLNQDQLACYVGLVGTAQFFCVRTGTSTTNRYADAI